MRRGLFVIVILLFTQGMLHADQLLLINGGSLEGEIVRQGDEFIVTNKTATTRVHKSEVIRWDRKPTDDEVYAQKLAALAEDNFDAQFALANWCRDIGMPDRAKWHFTMAVAIDPTHAEARRGAGYVRERGKWILYEQQMRQKGMVRYKGAWVTAQVATTKRMELERAKESQALNAEIWKFFRQVAREDDSLPLDAHVKRLVAYGVRSESILLRGINDTNERLRELCLRGIAQMSTEKTRDYLLSRHKVEQDPHVEMILAQACAQRPDRLALMKALGELGLASRSKFTRMHVWRSLQRMRDKRVIDMLVPLAGHNAGAPDTRTPDQIEEQKKKGKKFTHKSVGGAEKRSGSRDDPQFPYYPACEGLQLITGLDIPPSKERWSLWWSGARETFEIPLPSSGTSPAD